MSEYVGLVENRSEAARNLLRNMLEKDKITIEEYSEFLGMNQQLSKVLTELLIAGKMLQENQIIKDLSDLFRFYVKPKNEEQCFLEMTREK